MSRCETRRRSPQATPAGLLRGVVFDMGDVLYDATSWRRWLHRLLRRMGVHHSYEALFEIWDTQYLDDVHRAARPYGDAFRNFLRSLGLTPAQTDELVAASQARARDFERTARPFCGVPETLHRLHAAGFKLGILSDSQCCGTQLRRRLDGWGIGTYFAAVISSANLGCVKPDPRTYRAALSALELSPVSAAFVGHDAVELAGAQSVGMATIAFNYQPDATADAYIERFEQLDEVVRAWRPTMQAA